MVKITETSTRTLETSEEVAAYLAQRFAQMGEAAAFQTGEVVNIASRAGMPPEIGAGDVAVWIAASSGVPWSHVLVLTAGGAEIVVQVPTANLAKREPAAGGEQ